MNSTITMHSLTSFHYSGICYRVQSQRCAWTSLQVHHCAASKNYLSRHHNHVISMSVTRNYGKFRAEKSSRGKNTASMCYQLALTCVFNWHSRQMTKIILIKNKNPYRLYKRLNPARFNFNKAEDFSKMWQQINCQRINQTISQLTTTTLND